MRDISRQIEQLMQTEKCSSFNAFLTLQKETENVYFLQSKSAEQVSGRLCDKSDMQIYK